MVGQNQGNSKDSEGVYRVMNRTILALPLLLLTLGCNYCATPLFLGMPLAGDADGLEKLAGQWFDEEGNLVAVISSSPEPWLSVRTPYNLEPKNARLQNGEILFRLTNDDPSEISLRLTGEDELQVSMARESPDLFRCGGCFCTEDRLTVLVLLRNPSPAWHMQQTVRKTTEVTAEIARAAYDGALDRLARVL